MMKLKHLYHNDELVHMCLKNWDYDEEALDLLKYYRISSNAIYPLKIQGQLNYLRLTPLSEKSETEINQEIELLQHLKNEQVNVPSVSSTKDNQLYKRIETPWGAYYGIVIQGISGESLENAPLSDSLIRSYGSLLGQFHLKTLHFSPATYHRKTLFEHLDEVKDLLITLGERNSTLLKIEQIKKELMTLSIEDHNFGLIHYDFELDNVILEKSSEKLFAIDFDDAMYGWYNLDLLNAFRSIEDEVPKEDCLRYKELFIDGYQEYMTYVPMTSEELNILNRFTQLYKYARIKRSLEEEWENEPEWLVNLRKKLNSVVIELVF